MKQILYYLKVSRPGLWFPTLWLYFLPLGLIHSADLFKEPSFWLGLVFCTFPLNFLVYGWNDYVDFETDQNNPRKDSFLFGAQSTKEQLKTLPKAIILSQLLFLPFLLWFGNWELGLSYFGLILILGVYNQLAWSGKPPLELLCQFGYLLVVPFSMFLNSSPEIPWITFLYLILFSEQSHLMGEVMDIEPDREAGRKTTATILGRGNTKLLIMSIVLIEVLMLLFIYKDYIFGGMLGLGFIWLFLDRYILFKSRPYTMREMQVFAIGSNILGLLSMLYVWWSKCLLSL